MAKANKVQEQQSYPLLHTKDEIDVLWVLWHVAQERDHKKLKQVVSRMRARLGHSIAPRIFTNILAAENPFLLIETITENYLAKPPADELDLSQHGVCQVRAQIGDAYINEYIHVHFGNEREDILIAQRYEVQMVEDCAIKATETCGLKYAIVNVTLFKDHGFSGKTHQFVIGDEEAQNKMEIQLESV